MKHKALIAILLAFLITRFFALGLVYHQDEYKWALIADPKFGLGLESDHPPLVALLYRTTGFVAGFDHLRVLPMVVSMLTLVIVYALSKKLYGKKAALWTLGILLVSVYYLIASTQVDIDGALLPLFGFLAILAYVNIDFKELLSKKHRTWFIIFLLAIVGGFLIKLSFALFLGAIATEYLFQYRPKKKDIGIIGLWIIASVVVTGILVLILNSLFHIAHSTQFLQNTTHFGFFSLKGRNYSQVVFLTVKALILASPLLIAGYLVALSSWENIKKYRLWLVYLLYNFLFYYVIFDFSNRTMERYLMFTIIPGAILLGSYLAERFKHERIVDLFVSGWWFFLGAVFVALGMFTLKYKIFPLNPKSAYIHALKTLQFNFLLPITGGSGPVGFYVLVSFIVIFFALAFILFFYGYSILENKKWAHRALMGFLAFSLVYNLVLGTEMVSGFLYGSVNTVTKTVSAAVIANPAISQVITYYDIAGYELNNSGKYYKRFYTDPLFADSNVGKFSDYKGYYMVVDFPEIAKDSVYWKYLESCKTVFQTTDKNINGYIFDCKHGDNTLFSR